MAKRSAPEINAGSMADIAFLLLIFFLVTTTIDKDKGLIRQLPPPIDENQPPPPVIKNKNLFIVQVNRNNDLLVENELMELKDVRQAAIDFLDNGGFKSGEEGYCDYCEGDRLSDSSDNPTKAIISLTSDRLTDYDTYVAIQNELGAAYNFLRDREAQKRYGWKFTDKSAELNEGKIVGEAAKDAVREKLGVIKDLFPFKLTEAEAKQN